MLSVTVGTVAVVGGADGFGRRLLWVAGSFGSRMSSVWASSMPAAPVGPLDRLTGRSPRRCTLHGSLSNSTRCDHICAVAGLTPATSAPGLGSPLPHLRRGWAQCIAPWLGSVHSACSCDALATHRVHIGTLLCQPSGHSPDGRAYIATRAARRCIGTEQATQLQAACGLRPQSPCARVMRTVACQCFGAFAANVRRAPMRCQRSSCARARARLSSRSLCAHCG